FRVSFLFVVNNTPPYLDRLLGGGEKQRLSGNMIVMNWDAFATTFKLATITSLILLLIALPLSYWVAFSKWRFKFLVEAVVALPLVLPPTVLGFYVLLALGPQSPIGRVYERLAGRGLPFTFEGLVVGSVLYSLPFAVQPMAAAFGSVERKYI